MKRTKLCLCNVINTVVNDIVLQYKSILLTFRTLNTSLKALDVWIQNVVT